MRRYNVMKRADYPNGIREENYDKGVSTVYLSSWENFISVANTFQQYKDYIYRGEQCVGWKLESKFDRDRRQQNYQRQRRSAVLELHLRKFKTIAPKYINCEVQKTNDDWWALGQHHGLRTPLLDWTECPFIAAFFAFANNDAQMQTKYRVVYALNKEIEKWLWSTKGNVKFVKFFKPSSSNNKRLDAQHGLFTIYYNGNRDIKSRVQRCYGKEGEDRVILAELKIPNVERHKCLSSLNSRKINYDMLFPDMYGATMFCNHGLEINGY